MQLTKQHVQQVVAKITATYEVGKPFDVEDFDRLCIDMGIMPDADPEQRGADAWAARVYKRNAIRTKFNATAFDWSPPVQLIIHKHANKENGLGQLKLVAQDDAAVAVIQRRTSGPVSYYNSTQAEVRRIRAEFGDDISPSLSMQLDSLESMSRMKQMEAEASMRFFEESLAKILKLKDD